MQLSTKQRDDTAFRDEAKYQAILNAALKVFADKGFADTDVQLIADAAGVGKGTVYRYFGTKSDLFLAVADAIAKKLEKEVFAAIEGVENTIDVVYRAADAYARCFTECPEMVEILIQERAAFRDSIPATHMVYRRKNRGVFEELLRRGVESGRLRQVDPAAAVDALANCLYGTVVCGCLEGASDRLCETARSAVDLFVHGLVGTEEKATKEP